MQTLPISLFTRSYKNVDGTVLTDDAETQFNGFTDEKEGLNIRPGEALAINTDKRNDGLFHWPDKNYIVCVDEEHVTLRTVSGSTLVTFSTHVMPNSTGNPISFANYGDFVFFADGGRLKYITTAGVVAEIADPDAPTAATHVGFIDGYIVAIQGTKLYWAVVNDPTNWSALNFASAEGNPDLIKAMHVVQRQVYLLGTVTTEIWYNDGVSPFSRTPGGIIELGCGAPYSVIKRKNSLMWLTHERQFVEFTGIEPKIISGRYDKEIQDFSTIEDCIGGLVIKGGQEFCVFQFKTQGRTLAYNPKTDDWADWGRWDSSSMNWLAYDFRSSAKDINTGKVFVGKELARAIACVDSDSRKDVILGGTLSPFKFFRRSGFIDHGTGKKKRIEAVRFRAKRGTNWASVIDPPMLMLRYRDDGESNNWSSIRNISLGLTGDTNPHVELKRLGMCRSRQWEISATDDVPVVLSAPEVDLTIVR